MSASKARLQGENSELKARNTELFFMVVRLLGYVRNMQSDYPDLQYPDLPDEYSELMWRYAA